MDFADYANALLTDFHGIDGAFHAKLRAGWPFSGGKFEIHRKVPGCSCHICAGCMP